MALVSTFFSSSLGFSTSFGLSVLASPFFLEISPFFASDSAVAISFESAPFLMTSPFFAADSFSIFLASSSFFSFSIFLASFCSALKRK